MEAFSITLLLFLGFAVVIVTMPMKWFPQGRNYTVEKFGKHTRTDCEPGARVRVNGVDGVMLTFEPANA